MGRSGSTLIERAIAQIPGACGVGELVFLWDRGLRRDERCGCGERFSACSFWQRVGKASFDGWDQVDADEVIRLAEDVDDLRDIVALATPLATREFRARQRRYLEHYERLYAGIREVAGCDVVVDTSKLTPLAYNLRRSGRIDLRMLQLVRDPRAVAYSWTKRVRRPDVPDAEAYLPTYRPSYMALLWSGHNLLLELLGRYGQRSGRLQTDRLRYEDFVADPRGSLQRVAALAGLDVTADAMDFVTGEGLTLGTVHTVSGNPSRFQTGLVALRRDDGWRDGLPARARRTVTVLTAPGRRAYGYPTHTVAPVATARPVMGDAPAPDPVVWPSVGVVLVTHDRPELMRRALDSICNQAYPGAIEVRVVFDRATPDRSLETDSGGRPVRVLPNTRTPGLCGARNTGVLDLDSDLIAFCDDDDIWEPGKLRRQVAALETEPSAVLATTAMVVDVDGRAVPRTCGTDRVRLDQLIRSRLAMLHSSSFVARRGLVTTYGLVDESLPQSMCEDWELLLRAASIAPIVHVDEPLVRVQWGVSSHFVDKWSVKNEAHQVLLARYPAMRSDPVARGFMEGKLAFGFAALGQRRQALRHVVRSAQANWREPRWALALAVALRLVSADRVMQALTRRGHGI
jgi:hypothetical protein